MGLQDHTKTPLWGQVNRHTPLSTLFCLWRHAVQSTNTHTVNGEGWEWQKFVFVLSLFSLFLLIAVSVFVPPSSLLNPATVESHFIPPPVYLPSLSIFPRLIVLFFPSFPLILPVRFPFFSLNKSLLFPSLLYRSRLPHPFLCVPDSESVETKGHGGLTLIDALDRGEEEEGREGWLWADKVNSVFPAFLSPGSN